MYNLYFSNFGTPPVLDDLCKDSAPRHPQFWRRRLVKGFYHLGQRTLTILAIFHSPARGRLQMKFEQHWPRGFRGGHLKFSTFSPYKCMVPIQMHIGKQTWPHRKKVKCQCTTFILATLADLPSLLICAKIQPQGILGSGKDFYYIWVWQTSWSMDCIHFSNLLFPQPKEAPYEIWAKLAQQLQRRSR